MSSAHPTDPLVAGDIVEGKYRVTSTIGRGGMGIVYAAFHLELEQPVAIKVLATKTDQRLTERFAREAKAAAVVKGEHVCRVFDVGRLEVSGHPFIVMEHLEGGDLARKAYDQNGPFEIADVVGWIVQACDALSSAHARGIVHRDIKPANLFLHQDETGQEVIKVLDFGISKFSKPGADALTQTTSVMGSPLYMSPEQLASSRDVDARSDIWSLGVVMYELLTGEVPFEGENVVQLSVALREKPHAPISSFRAEIPPGLERVVDKCLTKSPDGRFSSVHHLVADLAPFAPPEVGSIVARLARLVKKPLPSSKHRVAKSSAADPWSGLPTIASIIGATEDKATRPELAGAPDVVDTDGALHQTLDPLQGPTSSPPMGKLTIALMVLAAVILALVALTRMAGEATLKR